MPSHYPNQYWVIVNWTVRNKHQWHLNQNTKLWFHENVSENTVCEMAAILSRGGGWGELIGWQVLHQSAEYELMDHNRWLSTNRTAEMNEYRNIQYGASPQICKIVLCTCARNVQNVFPATEFKGNRHASPHGLHARAVMHVGVANPRWRGNVPCIPGACTTRNFAYLLRGPLALTYILTYSLDGNLPDYSPLLYQSEQSVPTNIDIYMYWRSHLSKYHETLFLVSCTKIS